MRAAAQRKKRMPWSARAGKVTLPPANWKLPTQRTEKLSTGRPAGPPAPQSLLMVVSHAVRVAGGVSAMLLKYCAKNWPVGQPPPGGLIVNVSLFETAPSGLRTVTGAEPAVAMSAAAMAAVTRVTLTNVVVRATPFQKSVAPETKLLPSAVRVNAGPP